MITHRQTDGQTRASIYMICHRSRPHDILRRWCSVLINARCVR